jgi:hypothetical protein
MSEGRDRPAIGAGDHMRCRAVVVVALMLSGFFWGCARAPVVPAPGAGKPAGQIEPDDIPALARLLAQGQLSGRVHAAVHDRGLYVFTYYRNPKNVFVSANFPLKPGNDEVAQRLTTVGRHDAITIKGGFIENLAPIRHIRLDDFQVTKAYAADEVAPKRGLTTRIPEDLPNPGQARRELIGKVHAVADDGRILVIEYGDAVVPVFVPQPKLTAGLYRNDKVRVGFVIPKKPPRPQHLWLDTANPKPLEVLEALVDRHGKPFVGDGALVRYPKSPQLTSDVYALQMVDADNVSRDYTLLNFDPTIFKAIREKLSAAWNSRPGQGVDGRNKLVNPSIRVRAKGTFNLVARNQANAQILLASPDDLTITLLPQPAP